MGNAQAQIDYPRGLDFEQVWAALMENREQQKETDRQMKETDRVVKEIGKRLGDFTNSFGDVVEHLVAPIFWKNSKLLGLILRKPALGIKSEIKRTTSLLK